MPESVLSGVKQVIVVRRDLGMRLGKSVSQAAHASMAFLRCKFQDGRAEPLTATEEEWFETGQTKICVRVDSEEELVSIHEKALAAGLHSHLITDSGRTEFHGVPTKTAVAVGPGPVDVVNLVTGKLRLL